MTSIMKVGLGKAARVMLAVAIALTGVVGIGGARQAHADESAYLSVGGSIYYAGWNTCWFDVDGSMAYCGNPSAATPAAGTYGKTGIDAPSGRSGETVADLWFGFGSPGFDASMFPSTWYDGSDMDDGRYAALTHIIASDTFSSNGDYALYGCNQDFKDWARYNVIGFGEDGSETNPNATGRLMCARAGEVPSNFHAFQMGAGAGTQIILSFTYIPNGSVDLTKTMSNPSVAAGNACYSVKDAVYGVYSDSGCTAEVARMRTNDDGYARADEIPVGDYWVREISAPTGMALDERAYPVTVYSERTTGVNGGKVTDLVITDPVSMIVGKVDATTYAHRPQSVKDLSGAQFSVKYYDGFYSTAAAAAASGDATREWVFATDEDGFAYYADEFKVAGPELYRQTDGKTACMPLGTVVITEVKAPAGYNLDDGAGNPPKQFVVQITQDGAVGENVQSWNSPAVPDTIQRGDYRLFKEVPTNLDADDQELTRIAIEGVQFQIINENENAIVSPDTGLEVAKGGVVCTLTTDADGFATTKTHVPAGWSAALAYGEYTVHEVIPDAVAKRVLAEHGVKLIAVDDWKIAITGQGQYDPVQVVANHIPQTALRIEKVDSTTGKSIPLSCSFQIFDAAGKLVTYEDHMNEVVMDTWTTIGTTGHVTLPMMLPGGTYTVKEVAAPEGYVLGTDEISFTVDGYNDWDNPIVVTYADAPIRAEIQLVKTDGVTTEPVAGAEYAIKADGDIVTGDGTVRFEDGKIVGYVTTDSQGKAEVNDLYLGNYVIYETKSPEGWALDTQEHHVSIESQGQTVPVVVENFAAEDAPTTLHLLKVDALDEASMLANATFRVTQTAPAIEDELDPGFNANWEYEVTTDENGIADVSYLPHGRFTIEEIEAPEGFFIPEDATPIAFKVNDQGFIGLDVEGAPFEDTLELAFTNMPTQVDVTKADLTTGTELPGATIVLKDSEGNVVDEWVSITEAHRITHLAPGDYVLSETIAPEGYLLTTDVDVTILPTGEVQKAEMKDDYTKTDFSKTDATTGEEIAGAHLQVIDKDGKVVAEWDTDGELHRINGLEPGDYTLRETTAPDGYEVAEEVTFTVEDNGIVQKVEMKDEKTPDAPEEETPSSSMPKTGDIPWWTYALIGGAALCGGAITLIARKGLHAGKDEDDVDGGDEQ